MQTTHIPGLRPRALLMLLLGALCALIPAAAAQAAAPDPMDRGTYDVTTLDPFTAGTFNIQEPNAAGGPATAQAAAVTLQLRGSIYYPTNRSSASPVIVLVHGNHGSCDTGSAPNCTVFKRNDRGYAYLGENLATWGYTVLSLDQDQLMYYQDGQQGKGMHQRRLLIAAALDMLSKANTTGLPDEGASGINDRLIGKLDMTRIGLMGHSRGGDAVTSFIDYNRTRPAPGTRYPLRGVINLAGVDYERRAPYGVPYLSILPHCDGDVSNLQAARNFERGQYATDGDPFPKIQFSIHGTNHNWFNSVWSADGEDSNTGDAACSIASPNNIRLSGGLSNRPASGNPGPNDGWVNGGTYTRTNRGSGDPALMGDQNKIGLATMSAFFRRYVGGEAAFDEYMTGERTATTAGSLPVPETACPSQEITGPNGQGTNGPRMACKERMLTNYFAGAAERMDVLAPALDNALTESALGTAITGGGFSNPYLPTGGVQPPPPTTAGGFDWCNPEPDHFQLGQVGLNGYPTAKKGCPLPAIGTLGGQDGVRERGPVNQSYGVQLALAWDKPAQIGTRIPAASGDVTQYKSLAMAAAVNYFDPRNPARGAEGEWNPAATTQDFTVALTDASGKEATVAAGEQRYGNALHPTIGTTSSKVHIILNQIRIPLEDFAAQGLDLTKVRKLELRFGEAGKPATGSIQLSDVRFQEAASGPSVFVDTFAADGAAPVASTDGVTAQSVIDAVAPAKPSAKLPDVLPVAAKASCTPRVKLTRTSGKGGRLAFAGTTSTTCGKAVKSVQLRITKAAGKGKVRFVGLSGKLTKPMAASTRATVVAKGTKAWKLTTKGKVAKGTYSVSVTAIDAAGAAKTTTTKVTVR